METRDYKLLAEGLRYCSKHICNKDCGYYEICHRDRGKEYPSVTSAGFDAADAIEELQNLIAEVGKMICDLIAYAQKNADESREAEQRHYGSDSTVNVYTWMHNVKCVHERYVAMLDDIAAKLPEPPKGVE